MRILLMILLMFMLGYPLLAESECDKAKRFVTMYKANIDYHTTHLYKNPILQFLQRRLKLRVRNLEDALESPSLYELNCQRLLEKVKTRIFQMQAMKDIIAGTPSTEPAKKEEPAATATPPASAPPQEPAKEAATEKPATEAEPKK